MKILQIINSFNSGGAEKLLLETIPLYMQEGVQVDLLLLDGTDSPFLKELKVKNCCTIYSLGSKSVYNPIHIFKIIPFLKKYDIVHSHLFPSQYWVVLAKIISFSKVKILVTEHNTKSPRIEKYFFSKIDKFFYQFYDKVICISEEVFSIISQHTKLTEDKYSIIENGVDLNEIYNAKPYVKSEISSLIAENDILLIHVARFTKQKDQQTVIRAMKYLPSNVKLIFVGQGILENSCKSLVEDLDLNNKVIFLGSRMDVEKLLVTADISILSTNWEGLSLTAIESMASGKPFVASEVSGITNLVKDSGILFEKGNEKDLALKIQKLLDDQDLYAKTVEACKRKVKQYDIKFMIDKHINLYKTII
ncbi:glycosyltransferase family 4 protein [Flavobacterium denitrificans]|uniref:glycosyltransferase family 4 protein n=1 Tax=Flavobacterium denitrificans TaxID=281361 RepID=UPI00047A1599|nr:glycosyltransferase family 4 protein [Flavobacterium denitrificans]